jgi:hypothetical protein
MFPMARPIALRARAEIASRDGRARAARRYRRRSDEAAAAMGMFTRFQC